MTITLRQESDARASTKGSALTFQELDQNFIDMLNRQEITVEGDSGSAQLSADGTATDKRLVVNGAGGITTAVTSDSAGQLVLTVTQGASSVDFAEGVIAGTNIDVTNDSTGQVTVNLEPVVDDVEFKDYKETIYTGGTTTGTITPDVVNGNVQSITLSGNITFNAFSNPETGQTMTMLIKQPGSGGPYTLTSTMLFAGGTKTLSTAANAVDIMSVVYDGSNYYASLATNFS